mmetsp:Transcript_26257/g.25423  ORF Transcript_26257/g.25423 Transcript_26257/m.25423 type:complete len:145 (-) Transcript_26257:158-592(-)|eukprot:CAMPEP_0170559950 /NCGR_PEP_ID=MMETSP0211-20121228/46133_1 /TAXON_ID=311385 /ORGANISM="Pseudokeronopsis sp., Strain OXSARD2" /LENGTH=144 /DNA_ID=CAMNT_0010873607 /DNA_START=193 /DNA_END=627 /DNA_ORIENTATION=-
MVKVAQSQFKLSEKMLNELKNTTSCCETDMLDFFETYQCLYLKEKRFGRNELYDFLNKHFGITSPTFSDYIFGSFSYDKNHIVKSNLTFKELIVDVVTYLCAETLTQLCKVVFKAYSRFESGSKVAEIDRMLRGITKGRLYDLA